MIKREILQVPQGNKRYWLYSLAGVALLIIGLYFASSSSEQVDIGIGLGQAGVGFTMALWGVSLALPANRVRAAVTLRIVALSGFVVGIAAATVLLVSA